MQDETFANIAKQSKENVLKGVPHKRIISLGDHSGVSTKRNITSMGKWAVLQGRVYP